MALTPEERVIVALDVPDAAGAAALVEKLGPEVVYYKVGLELFTAAGDAVLALLRDEGKRVFLDLKFFDIPNTVERACRSAAARGAAMTNVHALGGEAMMRAARAGVNTAAQPPLLIAVTILTSMNEEMLRSQLHTQKSIPFFVRELAKSAAACGLDGVVASGLELPLLREHFGDEFVIVTPGIRPEWAAAGDQKRILTPREAFERGASYIVVGRPVTAAPDPADAFRRIIDEIS